MADIQVTNYDVLAFRGEDGTFCLSQYKNQIGNSRFEVLVDMYRESFELNEGRGQDEECQKIVDRLVEVACHKGVATAVNMSGRFLFKITENGPDDWNECNETQAKSLVREVLSNSPCMNEPVDVADLIALGLSLGPSNGMMQESAMLEGNKRGRRRSLLRRSASESVLGLDNTKKDRNKTSRPECDLLLDDWQLDVSMSIFGQPQPITRPVWAGSASELDKITEQMANGNGNAGGSTISIANAMDVILVQNCRELSQRSNIVGNNRLQVMLTLQKSRYPELSPSEQDKVAGDLVKAVCQHWGGRILAEDGYSYNELGHDQAVAAVKALLSPDTVPRPAIALIPTQSSSLRNIAPMIPTRSSPLLINGNKPPPKTPDLHKSAPASSLLANVPQPPEFLIQTSMDILRSHSEPDAPNMQSAAVKSLQQRNAKRFLAKTLGLKESPYEI